MKHYKDETGRILAFEEDGSQDHLIPNSAIKLTAEELNAIISPPLSVEQKIEQYRATVGDYINERAKAFGFDSIVTAVTYADEPADPLNQAYGIALRAWRSACWEKCREMLTVWQGGGEALTVESIIERLPEFKEPKQQA